MIAGLNAARKGLAFNRHWIVHYEGAGISEADAIKFIEHLKKLVSDYVRRMAGPGRFAAIWVRESGEGKGGHVHILMHLPANCSLKKGRTLKWIRLAGGCPVKGTSLVRSIGGSLKAAERADAHYRINVAAVHEYLLKGASRETGKALGLSRDDYGQASLIIGKRCGFTQNIAPQKLAARELSEAGTRARSLKAQ